MTTTAESIKDQNDSFRKSPSSDRGKFLLTRGIAAMDPQDQQAIIQKVQDHDQFPKSADPYAEHDFGAFDHQDQPIFWKIDYFDTEYQWGSEDPADPQATRRVLTAMLASEY